VETSRLYEARFARRNQRNDESVEMFAAELKMLYDRPTLIETAGREKKTWYGGFLMDFRTKKRASRLNFTRSLLP